MTLLPIKGNVNRDNELIDCFRLPFMHSSSIAEIFLDQNFLKQPMLIRFQLWESYVRCSEQRSEQHLNICLLANCNICCKQQRKGWTRSFTTQQIFSFDKNDRPFLLTFELNFPISQSSRWTVFDKIKSKKLSITDTIWTKVSRFLPIQVL